MIVLILALFHGTFVQAAPLEVTLAELSTSIDALESEPDALKRLVLQKIQAELSAANLTFRSGELLLSDTASNLTSDTGCNRTEVNEVTTSVTLNADTGIVLSLQSINEPILLAVRLDARLDAAGRARQVFGFRLNGCRTVGSDSFRFSASSDVQLSLQLQLSLNPDLDTATRQLTIQPDISLTGSLTRQGIRADVDDSLLQSVLERMLEDEIEEVLDQHHVISALARLERELEQRLDQELDNGALRVDLPEPSDEQVSKLYQLLSPQGGFRLSMGYLRGQRLELLAALILGDDRKLGALFSEAAQCEAAGLLQVPLQHQPLYTIGDAGCTAMQVAPATLPDVSEGEHQLSGSRTWFVDSACQSVVDFRTTSTLEFCASVLDRERLGNAASDVDQLGQWTLSPGTGFDIGAVSLQGQMQPFSQRVEYKSEMTDMGECALEMRIHSPLPSDESELDGASGATFRPLIAFHGGSWQERFSGALGVEAFATSLTNQDFVVFEPFYRLIGNREGNMECNNATLDEILTDASDAMSWVLQNARRYGAIGKPVLLGQSAGGHLAGLLAVERAAEVAAAVLFYAPVDFTHFAQQLINGEIETLAGQEILEAVVDQTLETVDPQAPEQASLFQRNSLPARIAIDIVRKPIPPFFLLHGQNDSVLPFQQSVRLCNALAGRALDSAWPLPDDTSELRSITDCGHADSQLHLIKEGEHALDLCIADELCLAGSPASAALTRNSVEQMLDWIKRVGVVQNDEGDPMVSELTADGSGLNIDTPDQSVMDNRAGATSPCVLMWLSGWAALMAPWRRRVGIRLRLDGQSPGRFA